MTEKQRGRRQALRAVAGLVEHSHGAFAHIIDVAEQEWQGFREGWVGVDLDDDAVERAISYLKDQHWLTIQASVLNIAEVFQLLPREVLNGTAGEEAARRHIVAQHWRGGDD